MTTGDYGNIALPSHAQERLASMRGTGGRRGLFTSDLSVNEFLLVKEAGFDPVGLVLGSSIYHIGFQMGRWGTNQELDVLTQAMYQARELAMTRMEEEADALGADGVIGVRLQVTRHEWGSSIAEFMAIGTAVRHREGKMHRTADNRPFTSDLSGQDFRTLLAAGYRPLALVMGSCVYHVGAQSLGQWFRQTIGQNVEMANYTQAIYEARELAMSRMQAEAEGIGADGVVGTRIIENNHGWDSHVIEFFAIGTAVVAISPDHQIAPPQMVLSLNDPS